METASTARKVRFVRCPKCMLVLPEVADFPVYKCGGCDAILVAKNKKENIAKSSSVSQETEAAAAAGKSVRVSEHGESSSSSQQEALASPPESRSSQESGGDQNVRIEDSSCEEHGENLSVEGRCNGSYEKDQDTARDSDGGAACDVLDENRSIDSHSEELDENISVEGRCNDQDRSIDSDGGGACDMVGDNKSIDSHREEHGVDLSVEGELDDRDEKYQYTSRDSDGGGERDPAMLDENRSDEGQENGTELLQAESLEHCNGSLSTNLHHENGSANAELETGNKIDFSARSSPIGEHRGVHSVRSTGTFDTLDFVSIGSELSEPMECLSKSTTVRSSHAYDGSISSYDGMDDHFPDQQLHSFENNYKPANLLSDLSDKKRDASENYGRWHRGGPIEPPRNWTRQERDQIPLPQRARKHPSQIPLPQMASLRGNESAGPSRELRDEPLGPPRNWPRQGRDQYPPSIPLPLGASLRGDESAGPKRELRDELLERPRNWPTLERDQYPAPIPLLQRASLRSNERAGPSHELRDEFPFHSALNRFEKPEYGDEENMKLLRMVYELQDQISKSYHLNGNTNGRTHTDVPWKESHFDTYNHQDSPEDENFHPTYYGRHGLGRRSRFSRVPFSGGAINTRDGMDTCLCCHPQALQHPDQLPAPSFPHNRGFCRAGAGHGCYNSYSSCPVTPQRYLESEFSNWIHETESDDQMYRDHELKRHLREKHHSVRRHIRPMAGGAPFVTCYHCVKPLQLPADFLLFKRKFHHLRCGACSKVLKFSLQKGTHIVPYELFAAVPPPSEVEDYGDATNVRISGLASSSHNSTMETDPLSYSDEYGQSLDISGSTDGNHVSHAKFHHLQGSSSSKPRESFDSAGPSGSKKVSSEMEGSPSRTRVSPLHRLMGYSTLSQVFRRNRPSISDTSSFDSGRN